MKNSMFETIIGSLVLIIAFLFFLLILDISKNNVKVKDGYIIKADFNNIEGINVGSEIKIAGVKIGDVSQIDLDTQKYNAILIMTIKNSIKIPLDSVFKVSSSGLMGGKFIDVKIGGDDNYLTNNSKAEFTESTMNLEDLISRFLFNKDEK